MKQIILAVLITLLLTTSAMAGGVLMIDGTAESGDISIDAEGAYLECYFDLSDWTTAHSTTSNNWNVPVEISYDNIQNGEIYVNVFNKVDATRYWDDMYYYSWKKMSIKGDGVYVPPGNGGRSVTVTGSDNTTGWIEYWSMDRKACFICDTRMGVTPSGIPAYIEIDEYVNYFAEQFLLGDRSLQTMGTLERMSHNYGIEPDPELLSIGLVDYSIERCESGLNITYRLQNFQTHPYDYCVILFVENGEVLQYTLACDTIGSSYKALNGIVLNSTVELEDRHIDKMYLQVLAKKAD